MTDIPLIAPHGKLRGRISTIESGWPIPMPGSRQYECSSCRRSHTTFSSRVTYEDGSCEITCHDCALQQILKSQEALLSLVQRALPVRCSWVLATKGNDGRDLPELQSVPGWGMDDRWYRIRCDCGWQGYPTDLSHLTKLLGEFYLHRAEVPHLQT